VKTIAVQWLESPHYSVLYRRERPGIVLVADDKVWGVKAPPEDTDGSGFSLPLFSATDPRIDRQFKGALQIRVQMLVVYAWQQGILDQAKFFGVIHNYSQNIMIGMGYTTVNVFPRFDHTPSYLFEHLPPEFEVNLEDILGPKLLQPRPGKSRHEREWVI
jgi:hypothetical protein